MNNLEKLQEWYLKQCNGKWEHTRGIKIDSLDNPGWLVQIDLIGTALEGKRFKEILEGIDKNGHPDSDIWIHCKVIGNKFKGAGDPTKLDRIIEIFLMWAEM